MFAIGVTSWSRDLQCSPGRKIELFVKLLGTTTLSRNIGNIFILVKKKGRYSEGRSGVINSRCCRVGGHVYPLHDLRTVGHIWFGSVLHR